MSSARPCSTISPSAGVDTSAVARVSGPSGVAPILVDENGQNSIVVVPGANGKVDAAAVDRQSALIRSAGMVLCQLELPIATVSHLLALCAEAGVPVMLDPAPAAPLPDAVFRQVSWFTPNETEAAFFLNEQLNRRRQREAPARQRPQRRGAQARERGCLRGPGRRQGRLGQSGWVKAFRVQAIDTVGAGDCFNGAFAVALLEGNDPFAAVRFASAAAAISVTRAGAQASMPTRAEVDAFLAAHP